MMLITKKHMSLLVLVIMYLFHLSSGTKITYNVQSYGAKPDGKTDSTKAFLNAWGAACASTKSVMIYVPQGRYLLANAAFWGQNCKNKDTIIKIDGTLVAPSNYNVIGNTGNWLKFERVNGLKISGGTFDGQGANLWTCKTSGKSCPNGATTLAFYNSNNIVISGLTSLNSQMFHMVIDGCQNAKLQNMKISASANSPNTDGIHIAASTGVTILKAVIGTGDDCISIGPGTSNLWIENVSCGPGHGISIGSLGWSMQEAGVQNVTVKATTFRGTQNGLRIKTWARPSNGFVKGVLFQHSVMVNARYPILIDQEYCPDQKNCPGQVSGVKISDVTYQDIHGTSTSQVALKLACSEANPCKGIRLEDVNLTFKNQQAQALCSNAAGTSYGVNKPESCL
ncbi:polygalacturonase-like [Solanum pennellii]|uniref:Polygalacturonase-like n=1 Tax=Solanum pennellii TaxID=28526 RepID=A0ABM1FS05_SOLPN|nr:polygalacturonase-like [Solanum pennellii]